MGDVATVPSTSLTSSTSGPAVLSNGIPSTIQITVVDEKGTKANCKLYRNEKLADILKKYNNRIHTNYDSIMINGTPIPLQKTPAQLGLMDGHVLQFCRGGIPVAASAPVAPPTSQPPIRTSTSVVVTTMSEADAGNVEKLQQRVAALEAELTQKTETFQNQIVNLEARLSEEQEKNQCRICFDRERDTLIFPCLHFAYCGKCLEEHNHRGKECPSCRTHISGVLKLKIGVS